MIELGKYTQSILIAYGVSLILLALLIWQSLARNAKVRRALEAQEAAMKDKTDAR
ncbi:MAG: heme exporter protein CcmD [Paracoccus sp. (in: a-proteobacteria)]